MNPQLLHILAILLLQKMFVYNIVSYFLGQIFRNRIAALENMHIFET